MDDLMGRIQEMLSDEESMQQIKELADMLSSSQQPQNSQTNQQCENNNSSNCNNNSDFGFDIGMIFKIQELMSSTSKADKNAELIMALKPHLSDDKKERADKAVKFLKLFSLFETLKSSGMLKDLDKLI
jgi:hypothetical protein